MREQTKDHRGIVVKGMAHLMAPQVIETRPRAVRDVFSERRSASYYTVKGVYAILVTNTIAEKVNNGNRGERSS